MEEFFKSLSDIVARKLYDRIIDDENFTTNVISDETELYYKT